MSSSEMDFHSMKRKELQALCKKHGIPANVTNVDMANKLASLLLKENEKPVTRGRSCLKSTVEQPKENNSDGMDRQSKKVRFSPSSEMIEFYEAENEPVELGRGRRRRSMGGPAMKAIVTVKNVDNAKQSRNTEIKQVMATRSRAKNTKNEDGNSVVSAPVEKKRVKRGVKSIASESVSTNETRVSTRRSAENKEVDKKKIEESKDEDVLMKNQSGRSLRTRPMKKDFETEKAPKKVRESQSVEKTSREQIVDAGHEIVDVMESADDSGIVGTEKNLRRSTRNAKGPENYVQLDQGIGKTEMGVGKGRTKRKRAQQAEDYKDTETMSKTEAEIEVVSQPVKPLRSSKRQPIMPRIEETGTDGLKDAIVTDSTSLYSKDTETVSKTEAESEVVSQTVKPITRSSKRQSIMPRTEETRTGGLKNATVTESTSLYSKDMETISKTEAEIEVVSQPVKPLRRSSKRRSIMPRTQVTGTDGSKTELTSLYSKDSETMSKTEAEIEVVSQPVKAIRRSSKRQIFMSRTEETGTDGLENATVTESTSLYSRDTETMSKTEAEIKVVLQPVKPTRSSSKRQSIIPQTEGTGIYGLKDATVTETPSKSGFKVEVGLQPEDSLKEETMVEALNSSAVKVSALADQAADSIESPCIIGKEGVFEDDKTQNLGPCVDSGLMEQCHSTSAATPGSVRNEIRSLMMVNFEETIDSSSGKSLNNPIAQEENEHDLASVSQEKQETTSKSVFKVEACLQPEDVLKHSEKLSLEEETMVEALHSSAVKGSAIADQAADSTQSPCITGKDGGFADDKTQNLGNHSTSAATPGSVLNEIRSLMVVNFEGTTDSNSGKSLNNPIVQEENEHDLASFSSKKRGGFDTSIDQDKIMNEYANEADRNFSFSQADSVGIPARALSSSENFEAEELVANTSAEDQIKLQEDNSLTDPGESQNVRDDCTTESEESVDMETLNSSKFAKETEFYVDSHLVGANIDSQHFKATSCLSKHQDLDGNIKEVTASEIRLLVDNEMEGDGTVLKSTYSVDLPSGEAKDESIQKESTEAVAGMFNDHDCHEMEMVKGTNFSSLDASPSCSDHYLGHEKTVMEGSTPISTDNTNEEDENEVEDKVVDDMENFALKEALGSSKTEEHLKCSEELTETADMANIASTRASDSSEIEEYHKYSENLIERADDLANFVQDKASDGIGTEEFWNSCDRLVERAEVSDEILSSSLNSKDFVQYVDSNDCAEAQKAFQSGSPISTENTIKEDENEVKNKAVDDMEVSVSNEALVSLKIEEHLKCSEALTDTADKANIASIEASDRECQKFSENLNERADDVAKFVSDEALDGIQTEEYSKSCETLENDPSSVSTCYKTATAVSDLKETGEDCKLFERENFANSEVEAAESCKGPIDTFVVSERSFSESDEAPEKTDKGIEFNACRHAEDGTFEIKLSCLSTCNLTLTQASELRETESDSKSFEDEYMAKAGDEKLVDETTETLAAVIELDSVMGDRLSDSADVAVQEDKASEGLQTEQYWKNFDKLVEKVGVADEIFCSSLNSKDFVQYDDSDDCAETLEAFQTTEYDISEASLVSNVLSSGKVNDCRLSEGESLEIESPSVSTWDMTVPAVSDRKETGENCTLFEEENFGNSEDEAMFVEAAQLCEGPLDTCVVSEGSSSESDEASKETDSGGDLNAWRHAEDEFLQIEPSSLSACNLTLAQASDLRETEYEYKLFEDEYMAKVGDKKLVNETTETLAAVMGSDLVIGDRLSDSADVAVQEGVAAEGQEVVKTSVDKSEQFNSLMAAANDVSFSRNAAHIGSVFNSCKGEPEAGEEDMKEADFIDDQNLAVSSFFSTEGNSSIPMDGKYVEASDPEEQVVETGDVIVKEKISDDIVLSTDGSDEHTEVQDFSQDCTPDATGNNNIAFASSSDQDRPFGTSNTDAQEVSAAEDTEVRQLNLEWFNVADAFGEEDEGKLSGSLNYSTILKLEEHKSSLTEATPKKLMSNFDMKENATSVKRVNLGDMSVKSTAKRRALSEIHK